MVGFEWNTYFSIFCETQHITYDEAHSSVPASKQPPMATALMQSGYRQELEIPQAECILKVKLLHDTAHEPVRGSQEAAGLDIHSAATYLIPPGAQQKISTKLAMEFPPGYHGQLCVRSGHALKQRARIEAGTIDSDYRGEVFVLMTNNGENVIHISPGDRIAQMLIIKDPTVKWISTHH